ncbi:hypothetical protein EDD22DRAFT_844584 [Suillus occidentalis]|nr:hypothetical protein EDD22DRAFT_844584 [Suillus occidentalis]
MSIPTPAPSSIPEETAHEDLPTLDLAILESIIITELELKAEDMHVLCGWNTSLATMGKLHEGFMYLAEFAEEKTKIKAADDMHKKVPVCEEEGEEEYVKEELGVSCNTSDEPTITILVRTLLKLPQKGKGKANCKAPTAICKAPHKNKEDHPPVGHITMDDIGESELDITNVPPPVPKRKKKEMRLTLNLPAHARVPNKPEDTLCTEAGLLMVHWTEDHTLSLIKFLAAHKSEAGDGMNFKIRVFQAAAAYFLESPEGVSKEGWVPPAMTRDSLLNLDVTLIFRYEKKYKIVFDIKYQSVFSWDNEFGAGIDSTSEAVWVAYVKRRLDATPFHNKGWPHFNEVDALLSATASKGTHAFHAALEESRKLSPQPDLDFLNEEGLLQSEPGQKLCKDQNTLLDEDGHDEDLIPWETTPPH